MLASKSGKLEKEIILRKHSNLRGFLSSEKPFGEAIFQ